MGSLYIRESRKYVGQWKHLDEWTYVCDFEELASKKLDDIVQEADFYSPEDGPVYEITVQVKGDEVVDMTDGLIDTIKQALNDEYTSWGCDCLHDCCGCASYTAGKIHWLGGPIFQLRVSTSYNY